MLVDSSNFKCLIEDRYPLAASKYSSEGINTAQRSSYEGVFRIIEIYFFFLFFNEKICVIPN